MRFQLSLLATTVLALPLWAQTPRPSPQPTVQPKIPAKVRPIVPIGAPSFTSKAGSFSIWLPSPPTQSRDIQPISEEETVISYSFETDAEADTDRINYTIQAATTPPSADLTSPQIQLDGMQEGFLERNGAKVRRREPIQLAGAMGRELQVTLEGGEVVGRVRMFFTPRFFYTITAAGLNDDMRSQSAQVNRFLDSFRIAPEGLAPRIPALITDRKLGLEVRLPMKPVATTRRLPEADGTTTILHLLQAKTEGVGYVVGAQPINASLLNLLPGVQLQRFERGYVLGLSQQGSGAVVQKRAAIQQGGFQGVELQTSLTGGKFINRSRIYFTPKGFYLISATGSKADALRKSAEITRVFDSFRVLPQ